MITAKPVPWNELEIIVIFGSFLTYHPESKHKIFLDSFVLIHGISGVRVESK
jgi:hypothetical protein